MSEECIQCGAELPSGSKFCLNCGRSTNVMPRPVTVSVAAITLCIFGSLTLLAGFLLASIVSTLAKQNALISSIFGVLAALTLLVGFLYFGSGYGLWNMRKWAAISGMLVCFSGIFIQTTIDSFSSFLYGFTGWTEAESVGILYAQSMSAAGIWINILIIGLIAISWRSFES